MKQMFLFASALLSVMPADAAQPNIVFLFADDQCAYSVGCYGNQDVQTPNMDQLARDGLAFDRHYNTTAFCMASRASVSTLASMRKRYDQELAEWKQHAVEYNDYQPYGTLFDRTTSLDDKRAFMVKERRAERK